jgi:hypothetical protein
LKELNLAGYCDKAVELAKALIRGGSVPDRLELWDLQKDIEDEYGHARRNRLVAGQRSKRSDSITSEDDEGEAILRQLDKVGRKRLTALQIEMALSRVKFPVSKTTILRRLNRFEDAKPPLVDRDNGPKSGWGITDDGRALLHGSRTEPGGTVTGGWG